MHDNQPFSDDDVRNIFRDEPDGCNVFPKGVPGPFDPVLVILVDDPNFKRGKFDQFMRERVIKHMSGQKTEKVVLVSRTRSSMSYRLGVGKFRGMVDQWRWIDDTFAPDVLLRTDSRSWEKWYPRFP